MPLTHRPPAGPAPPRRRPAPANRVTAAAATARRRAGKADAGGAAGAGGPGPPRGPGRRNVPPAAVPDVRSGPAAVAVRSSLAAGTAASRSRCRYWRSRSCFARQSGQGSGMPAALPVRAGAVAVTGGVRASAAQVPAPCRTRQPVEPSIAGQSMPGDARHFQPGFQRGFGDFCGRGSRWASFSRSMVRPRWIRDRTVPSLTPSAAATSS